MTEKHSQELYRSNDEDRLRRDFVDTFRRCPVPEHDLMSNLGLFINSKNLSRILFMHHIYEQIVDIPGIVIEFGTRWGQNAALFAALRGIYDPFNRHRKIVAFDTFEGFPSVSDKDNTDSDIIGVGSLATTENYKEYLAEVLDYHEADNPMSHIRKYDIRKGDAPVEIDKYLEEHPETIIALAYFDLDLYDPTKRCLERIRKHLVKGSVLGFDELNDDDSPGETIALDEVMGLSNLRLKRWRYASRTAYFVVE
ncbi:MAG: crotonobetainyl-CoA--carnitine CoA-transferase [Rhodospirillales bacterium]|nr:crotonobetainyl-CoA--carnitine CoA-transferase [Rhodospirillales bacterium]